MSFSKSSPALQAYILLLLTSLMWAGNVIAGRLAVGEVSPMVLVSVRWLIVCAVVGVIAWREIKRDAPVLLQSWKLLLLMGVLGFTAFNALFYVAAYFTVAANIAILQGVIPIFVMLGAFFFLATPVLPLQMLGAAVTLCGALLVATKGHPEILSSFAFNAGDGAMTLACLLYAAYTLLLKKRPQTGSLSFFMGMAIAAFVTSLPLLAAETAMGLSHWPSVKGWWITLYVALFPSLLGQLFFIWGVERIGPARAGTFTNLVPVFGPALGILILGEALFWYHLAGLVLVLGGILIVEWASTRFKAAPAE